MRPWIGFIALLFACLTQAHERSESTSNWTLINGELHGVVTARTREVTRLTVPGDSYASLAQIFAAHVGRSITVSIDGVSCTPHQAPAVLESESGYVRADVRMRCGATSSGRMGSRLAVHVDLLFAVAPSHHHFLYVAAGNSSREAILSASDPSVEIELRPSGNGQTHFPQFIGMGIEHIATGIDHLAFLLALLITARTARQVLTIVTGFTVGHSITLSLAVLGFIRADRGAVECLIGLTIAVAAAQNLIRSEREGRTAGLTAMAIATALLLIPADLRPEMPASLILAIAITTGSAVWLASIRGPRSVAVVGDPNSGRAPPTAEVTSHAAFFRSARFAMAAIFGLIHGLGFASALQDLHLPRPMLLSSLLGFNIGVEIGQLAVVSAAVAMILATRKIVRLTHRAAQMSAVAASAVLLAAGLAWFLTRAY